MTKRVTITHLDDDASALPLKVEHVTIGMTEDQGPVHRIAPGQSASIELASNQFLIVDDGKEGE